MKRFLKKSVAVLLSVLVICSSGIYSLAAAVETKEAQIFSKIEKSLWSIANEKEHYGLGNVDFTNLFIGSSIQAYEVRNQTILPLSLEFYPIFENNQIVTMAAATMVDNEIFVSISDIFVDALNEVTSDEKVCFIYDSQGVYLLKNQDYIKLADHQGGETFGRDSITQIAPSAFSQLSAVFLNEKNALPNEKNALPIARIKPYGSDDEEIYRNVPKVLQPSGSSICWAACMASVANYKLGTDHTAQSVSTLCGYTTAQTLNRMYSWLDQYFHLYYITVNSNNNSFDNIWASLNADNPVIALFDYSTNTATKKSFHFMVVRGMYYYGSFSVMDPLDTNNTYRTGQITGTGKTRTFSILSWTGGSTMTIIGYGYNRLAQ